MASRIIHHVRSLQRSRLVFPKIHFLGARQQFLLQFGFLLRENCLAAFKHIGEIELGRLDLSAVLDVKELFLTIAEEHLLYRFVKGAFLAELVQWASLTSRLGVGARLLRLALLRHSRPW